MSLIGLLAGSPARGASPADVPTIAQAVDSHYNHLRTLQADFVEIYTGAGTERTESGTLLLKKPGKMRWDYRSPREKLFLSDGKQAWFYIPGEQQASKISAHQLEDLRSPLAFLLGKSRLEKELKGLSLATDISALGVGDTVLRGVPVGREDRVSQVVLEITPDHKISRILLDGTDGSVTEYRFSNQQENIQVSDQQFHFVPPPGVEIIEGDFAQ
ncbi:MAG TPA: outer membrane lipoprotein chaperone LolA [Terriglobales bacterium]|jgi:outer membrane lipoprotein carrier protein|nr:outer membrane lipoprotein chaperone LolA [Terriglobales bacterium]